MVRVEFEVSGVKELSRDLRVSVGQLSDMSPFLKDAIGIVSERSDEIFRTEGKNVQNGPRWSPLSSNTKKARNSRWGYYKRQPSQPRTLRWTGRLQTSRKFEFGRNFSSMEFTAPYAAAHQSGGKNLPQRKIIDLDRRTNNRIIKSLQKYIERKIRIFGRQI